MGKLSKNFRNKSFKQMKLERQEKREATARFKSLMPGSNGRATTSAQNQARPIVSNRSAQAAEHIAGATGKIKEGYQEDGSYIDRNGVRMSKAYMDNLQITKEDLPGKGEKGQRCNRSACQAPGAYWYNHSTQAYYCKTCSELINSECRNDEYVRNLGHPLLTLDPDFASKA